MSEYRLTERQVDSLNLIPVTWQEIRKVGADTVYIRAHSDSATYGPYKVKDASRCIVCKLDGSDARHYPRDKGLFVSQFMRKDLQGLPAVGDMAERAILESMVTELSRLIIDKRMELLTLQQRHDVLTQLLKQG
jgi:hypothetical protein